MSSEWQNTTLGQICAAQGGAIQTGPFGSQLHTSDYREAGVPVVMPTNIGDGGIVVEGIARIDQSDVDRLSQHKLQMGDIVFSRRGDVTKNALIRQHEVGWFCGTGCLKVRLGDESLATAKFISHYLRLPDIKDWLVRHAVGATMPNLNTGILSEVPICLPPLQVQFEIAGMLGALDDRITLLRETNATLEAIAQALFKSWFVDFDPVRAKMEGRAPEGMDEATAALFPDGFEESELGLVPTGWRVGKVGDFARLHKGSINPLQNPEVMYEHFSLPAYDNQQMPVSELGTEIKSNKTSVPPDAVLLSKLNPHIPRIWLPVDVGNHAVCSTEFLVFVPAPNSGATKEFIYSAFTTAKFKELLCQLVTGTSNSHQRVKPDGVSTMSAVIPNNDALKAFGSMVKPIFERIGHNRGKAQTLATLRDTLLPRLISGQLRLPEALEALA